MLPVPPKGPNACPPGLTVELQPEEGIGICADRAPSVSVSVPEVAVPATVSVIESELTGEKTICPVTVVVIPEAAKVGQFNTSGPAGVASVRLNVAAPVTPQGMEAVAV